MQKQIIKGSYIHVRSVASAESCSTVATAGVEKKNGDVFVPFHPVETEVKWSFPYTTMGTGRAEADGTERAVDYSNHS
jgi:hypothetical protein